jgi:hypothetical protein
MFLNAGCWIKELRNQELNFSFYVTEELLTFALQKTAW